MEETVMNILIRLPVKSLFRFHCVSKFWKTLICEAYFEKMHLNHVKNQPRSQKLLFHEWDPNGQFWSCSVSLFMEEDIPIFDLTSHTNPIEMDSITVYSSCDGLFLIGIWTERHVEQPHLLVIWNPSTRQSTRLAHTRFPRNYSDDDDDDMGSAYGLAYDSTSDDYKIFRIDIFGKYDNEILTLKNGSWRIIDGKTPGRRVLRGGEFLAFVDGAFHWLGFLSMACLISFNISDEMYEEIPLLEIVSSQLTRSKINDAEVEVDVHVGVSVLRGMLGVYYNDKKDFNLWVMKKYGGWMKLFTIPSVGFYKIIPTYAFSDDQVLVCFNQRIWVTPNSLKREYIYRIICGGSSDHRMFPQGYYDIGGFTSDEDGFPYTETLIFPKLSH